MNTIISINVVFIIHCPLSGVFTRWSSLVVVHWSLLTKIDSLMIRSKDSMLLEFMKILKIFSRKNCLELDNQPNNQPNY